MASFILLGNLIMTGQETRILLHSTFSAITKPLRNLAGVLLLLDSSVLFYVSKMLIVCLCKYVAALTHNII